MSENPTLLPTEIVDRVLNFRVREKLSIFLKRMSILLLLFEDKDLTSNRFINFAINRFRLCNLIDTQSGKAKSAISGPPLEFLRGDPKVVTSSSFPDRVAAKPKANWNN
jgi:hypothetical protein